MGIWIRTCWYSDHIWNSGALLLKDHDQNTRQHVLHSGHELNNRMPVIQIKRDARYSDPAVFFKIFASRESIGRGLLWLQCQFQKLPRSRIVFERLDDLLEDRAWLQHWDRALIQHRFVIFWTVASRAVVRNLLSFPPSRQSWNWNVKKSIA